jgi:hypothetical protein
MGFPILSNLMIKMSATSALSSLFFVKVCLPKSIDGLWKRPTKTMFPLVSVKMLLARSFPVPPMDFAH